MLGLLLSRNRPLPMPRPLPRLVLGLPLSRARPLPLPRPRLRLVLGLLLSRARPLPRPLPRCEGAGARLPPTWPLPLAFSERGLLAEDSSEPCSPRVLFLPISEAGPAFATFCRQQLVAVVGVQIRHVFHAANPRG